MRLNILILLLCSVMSFDVSAAFRYDAEAKQIYNLIFALKFDEAQKKLQAFKQNQPDNDIFIHLENYIDVIAIFLSEEEQKYKSLKPNKARRMALLDDSDKDSPYYLYIKADIELQWALVHLKFSEYLTAFLSVKRAFNMLNKNKSLHPYFLPNMKSLGVLHAIVGAIPQKYKWGVKLLSGMDGTIKQGQNELLSVISQSKGTSFPFLKETYTLYSFINLHLEDASESAWTMISKADLDPVNNHMDCFILANLALRSGRYKEAKAILKNRKRGSAYFPFDYLDYLEGLVALYDLDPEADIYFLKYVTNFKGINYIKQAYQKLAWHSLIIGDKDGYFEYMEKCRDEGFTKTGGDKNALKEALKMQLPQVDLLKARILFDGGNYDKAASVLFDVKTPLETETQNLEYTYRLGRIEDKRSHFKDAIYNYNLTINLGYYAPDYFACNAALQLGKIYEHQNNCKLAKSTFKKCIDIEPYDYARSLHALAKAGLNRLKNCQ